MERYAGKTAFSNAGRIVKRMYELGVDKRTEELTEYGYPVDEKTAKLPVRIFTGHSGAVSNEVGVSRGNYSHAMNILKSMRAITLLRSGGPGFNSVYIVHYIPTEEQFDKYRNDRSNTTQRVAPNKYQQINTELELLRLRTKEQRETLIGVKEIIIALQVQVDELQKRVKALEDGRHNL